MSTHKTNETNETNETKLTAQEIVETLVIDYVEKNEVTPFADIDASETGLLNVDVDSVFEQELTEALEKEGYTLKIGLQDYFTAVIRDLVEAIENGEFDSKDNLIDPEDEPQGVPEAP